MTPFIVLEIDVSGRAFEAVGCHKELSRIVRTDVLSFAESADGCAWSQRPMDRHKLVLSDIDGNPAGMLRWAIGERPVASAGQFRLVIEPQTDRDLALVLERVATALGQGALCSPLRRQGVDVASMTLVEPLPPAPMMTREELRAGLGLS